MSLKCGIVGLPNIGKSTLFNTITKSKAEIANYPFCTIDPNISLVSVPDKRLDNLAKLYKTKNKIYSNYKFFDIAGLVKGASKGEGLGNSFLSNIREVDAIAHVVRCFKDESISHVEGAFNPKKDIEIINLELMLSDLESISKHMKKLNKKLKGHDKEIIFQYELMEKIYLILENEQSIKKIIFNEKEKNYLKELNLLTLKPVIYIANIHENDIPNKNNLEYIKEIKDIARIDNSKVISISAKIESEIAELSNNEKNEFLNSIGLKYSGIEELIKTIYDALGLITYFTAGQKECKAWTVKDGTSAQKSAGIIHSDFEKGFIRAEVISYDNLMDEGSELKAKEHGKLRLEGKNYIVKDGDIMHFRFNI